MKEEPLAVEVRIDADAPPGDLVGALAALVLARAKRDAKPRRAAPPLAACACPANKRPRNVVGDSRKEQTHNGEQ
jgi:hypothetical protein